MDKKLIIIGIVLIISLIGIEILYLNFPNNPEVITYVGDINYSLISYGNSIKFLGNYEDWMKNYTTSYFEYNGTVTVYSNNVEELYYELLSRNYTPLIKSNFYDPVFNTSFSEYIVKNPINSTLVFSGRFQIYQQKLYSDSPPLKVQSQISIVPYRLVKIYKTLYKNIYSFENRSRAPIQNNKCNVTSIQTIPDFVEFYTSTYIIVKNNTSLDEIQKYFNATCEDTIYISDELLNPDRYENAYLALLESSFPPIVTYVSEIKPVYNVTLEYIYSGTTILDYKIIKVE